jgi:toxin HigB-1
MAIQSFSDHATEVFFKTGSVPKGCGWANVKNVAARKLDMIEYANVLSDLKSPPGNRLELLTGNLAGLHSIRINDQWRFVFRWGPAGPQEVRICDYHS